MRVIVGFMVLFGVVLLFLMSRFNFSDTVNSILLSLIVGIVVFIFVSGLTYSSLSNRSDKLNNTESKIKKRKKKANLVGLIFMVVFMVVFFNFYLHIKTMLGNDLLVSLNIEEENFVIKNGEEVNIEITAKVLTNPFCKANCFLTLRDLSNDELIYEDNIFIKVSSPLSKEYKISSAWEQSGQKLYKVTLNCNNIEDRFCYSYNPSPALRTRIISVDHDLNEIQELIKNNLKNNIKDMNTEVYIIDNNLGDFNFDKPYLNLSDLRENSIIINNSLISIKENMSSLSSLYLSQDYFKLGTDVYNLNQEIVKLNSSFNELNSSYFGNISLYNLVLANLSIMHQEIIYLEDYNFSEYSLELAKSFINDFNSFISIMEDKNSASFKLEKFNELSLKKENLSFVLQDELINNISRENKLNISIYEINLPKFNIEYKNYTLDFVLGEPSPICCLHNECYDCIDDASLNYPIIFVHGHSFNEKISPELSMDSFGGMAGQLEKDGGYLDAGYFYRSQYDEGSKGYLGRVNSTIVVEATYYIDTVVTDDGSFMLTSKWESIDTYASRLNDIVSNVKYITGKDKVIIVAHSMGGLVTRKYIQLYGEDSLEKIVLIGIPNHGVDGFVLNYCAVFGADLECSEMNKSSEFILNLNSVPLPDIPIYNLVGVGCFWEGSDGDGIVKSSSAYLDGAENIYVNGTCNLVDFFHVRMVHPSLHPEIYNIVKEKIEIKEVYTSVA